MCIIYKQIYDGGHYMYTLHCKKKKLRETQCARRMHRQYNFERYIRFNKYYFTV